MNENKYFLSFLYKSPSVSSAGFSASLLAFKTRCDHWHIVAQVLSPVLPLLMNGD